MPQWFYAEGSKQKGPLEEPKLRAMLARGEIAPDVLVWREGMPQWAAARSARGLLPASTAFAAPDASRAGVQTSGQPASALSKSPQAPGTPPDEQSRMFSRFSRWGFGFAATVMAFGLLVIGNFHGREILYLVPAFFFLLAFVCFAPQVTFGARLLAGVWCLFVVSVFLIKAYVWLRGSDFPSLRPMAPTAHRDAHWDFSDLENPHFIFVFVAFTLVCGSFAVTGKWPLKPGRYKSKS